MIDYSVITFQVRLINLQNTIYLTIYVDCYF